MSTIFSPHSLQQKIGFGNYKNVTVEMAFSGTQQLPDSWVMEITKAHFNTTNDFKPLGYHYKENFLLEFTKKYVILSEIGTGHSNSEHSFDDNYFYDLLKNYFDKNLCLIDSPKYRTKVIDLHNEILEETKCVLPSGVPDYLDWAIKNTNMIFMNPKDLLLLQGSPVQRWLGLGLERISKEIFRVIPLYKEFYYIFSDEAHIINGTLHNNFLSKKATNTFTEYGHDNTTDNYSNYGGPSDGYGGRLDDEYIDDAFGGEADAYWNID